MTAILHKQFGELLLSKIILKLCLFVNHLQVIFVYFISKLFCRKSMKNKILCILWMSL